MKITQKHLRLLSGFLLLIGAIVGILTGNFNTKHPEDPNVYGKWISIGIMIIGLVLLAPWIKEKEK
jgi:hypothetical protein